MNPEAVNDMTTSLPKPYYQDSAVTLYLGDCREIVPTLGRFDLLLTDPPYGIKQDRGANAGGVDGFGNNIKRAPKQYAGGWDNERPDKATFDAILAAADVGIIWGGQYFADIVPTGRKWLVWDKCQTMPTYSDAELAWTSMPGVALKMFEYNGSGLMAVERDREHPTQKPLALMRWCLELAGDDAQTVLDPFAGSGTTGRACKDLGRKCVMIEREERYCEIAARRMGQEVLNLT
jgi:DNA modification methylase